MTDKEKRLDIHNRYTLTLAEREIIQEGTENYNILSKLAKLILDEYANNDDIRYGFRLYGSKYHIVKLSYTEKY